MRSGRPIGAKRHLQPGQCAERHGHHILPHPNVPGCDYAATTNDYDIKAFAGLQNSPQGMDSKGREAGPTGRISVDLKLQGSNMMTPTARAWATAEDSTDAGSLPHGAQRSNRAKTP
mmetsp:Transcript_12454/g.18693  ORF Transcript_12454/g.18693 Transcript_12454/m.18693 type:complete len:117 (+) Transcript_12454:350-700(+)